MRGLLLAVVAAVICTAAAGYQWSGHHGKRHHGYSSYNYKKYCPLEAYYEKVTKKIAYGDSYQVCYGKAVRHRCYGKCHYSEHHYGGYGHKHNPHHDHYGHNHHNRYYHHGKYYKSYGYNKCCSPSKYVWQTQYVTFHCGHYGYKKLAYKTKEPGSCKCSYCHNKNHKG